MLPWRITFLHSERLSCNPGTNWRICPAVNYSGQRFWSVQIMRTFPTPLHLLLLGHRLAITSLIVDSTNVVETGSPYRRIFP